ncbi:MAG: AAA family ATPase [Marinobacter sp.]|nr:AAA family ATPase [Marinobacter sp.]
MYYDFFGLREPPFSIAPDPRYLYLSERHKEALAHLMYGVKGQGGFIVITGEVGTGKTTVSRCFLDNVPEHVDIALILNPRLSARELLSAICDEFEIPHPAGASFKRLIDLLNQHLLKAHSAGRHPVLLIDEAQNLSADVLEQLRLLTNLETAEKKLLQIVLLGQPELQDMLIKPELRQLAQRVTARYHLDALERHEVVPYLKYRLSVAGQRTADIFTAPAIAALYRASQGIPRLINLIADRALLGAYAEGTHRIEASHIRKAAKEVFGAQRIHASARPKPWWRLWLPIMAVLLVMATAMLYVLDRGIVEPVQALEEPTPVPMGQGVVDREPAEATESEPVPQPSVSAVTPAPVEPPAPAPGLRLDDLLSTLPDTLTRADAFAALFRLWGHDYQPASSPIACNFADTAGLRCLHRQGSWRSLTTLDRPAILRLSVPQKGDFYLTLQSVEGDKVKVLMADESVTLDRQDLERYWMGDFTLLWRLPPSGQAVIDLSERSEARTWLSMQMMQLVQRHTDDPAQTRELLGAPLEAQVRWFQGIKGLTTDGIPGAVTLIHINSELSRSVPRLTAGPTLHARAAEIE